MAERVAHERAVRKWTLKETSLRMESVGCPIQISALQRIEKGSDDEGSPQRAITVDELVAFAKVFEIKIEDFLSPIEYVRNRAAAKKIDSVNFAIESLLKTIPITYRAFQDIYRLKLSSRSADNDVFLRFSEKWDGRTFINETLAIDTVELAEDRLYQTVCTLATELITHIQGYAYTSLVPPGEATLLVQGEVS